MVFDRCKVQARELYLESYRRNSNEERDLGSKTENDQLVSEALRYGILNGRQGLYPYEVAVISLEESLHMRLAEEQRVEDERYFSDLEVIATTAPSLANSIAIACPIPVAPPVISAFLPSIPKFIFSPILK